MTLRLCLMLNAIAVFLAGCATEPGASFECDWAEPIRPSQADQLTDGTARQILNHNETGARLCGWRL